MRVGGKQGQLGRKNCEYVVGECGWVKSFSCVLVNLMTHKDRSRGGQWCSVCLYRSCTTLPSCRSVRKPTMIVVAVQGPPTCPFPILLVWVAARQVSLCNSLCQIRVTEWKTRSRQRYRPHRRHLTYRTMLTVILTVIVLHTCVSYSQVENTHRND